MKHNLVECTTCDWIGSEDDLQDSKLPLPSEKCPQCNDIHVWNIDWVDAEPKLRQEYRKLSRRMEWSDDLYNHQRRHYIEQILAN